MGSAHRVGKAFFPLDEELGLGSERLTPHAHECLVRFGSWAPFPKAAQELAFSVRVRVSEATARRYAEAAGAAYVRWQTMEVDRLERETPEAPQGVEKLLFSVDGAFVPLVGGDWTEVKTLVLGEIEAPVLEQGEWVVHSQAHSYFSRVAEADQFRRLALVETHARGVERAGQVAAVMDGAEWEQGMIDFHCPQAVRILDFPHAGEYLHAIGQTVWGVESEASKTWLAAQLHQLKHEGPVPMLADLHHLHAQHPAEERITKSLAYLQKREEQMHYPDYQAKGLPIGSGAVESSNKVVVEARLKGAGMHWALAHVNPMLALRNILCSDRWETAWPQIKSALHQTIQVRKQERHAQKQSLVPSHPAPAAIASPVAGQEFLPATTLAPPALPPQSQPSHPKPPAADHPWRHSPIGRAKYQPVIPISKN